MSTPPHGGEFIKGDQKSPFSVVVHEHQHPLMHSQGNGGYSWTCNYVGKSHVGAILPKASHCISWNLAPKWHAA